MAIDYTVIMLVRQWFGDRSAKGDDHATAFGDWETAPFVGSSKDYSFDCPNVDSSQPSVLQFRALGVETKNVLQINGHDIHGGLTASPLENKIKVGGKDWALWSTYSMVVHAHVLSENNVLRIASVVNPFTGNFDDFIVDDVVLFYKTRGASVPKVG